MASTVPDVLGEFIEDLTFSSDEEDFLLFDYVRSRKRRAHWIHPYIRNNHKKRLFVAARELLADDNKFRNFYRMREATFTILVNILRPHLLKNDTNMREAVPPEERIMITLRYLATGATFSSLGLYFARGDTTVSQIVAETTEIMWDILKSIYMKVPTTEKWRQIANRYHELWQLPHCLGAIDGKHIRIQQYPNSGSSNYNYKGYHSIVLMGCADPDGYFTFIETGYPGRNSDGGIFQAGGLGQWIQSNNNNVPDDFALPNDTSGSTFPYYFVADNAFPLKRNILRPYPLRNMCNKKRVFNYRLSRGRKNIECAFGMMTQKFQVLMTPIRCKNYETINNVIKCICVLHNFIRKHEGVDYGFNPTEDRNTYHAAGNQQIIVPEYNANLHVDRTSSPNQLRDYLANYFLKPSNSLPWQWQLCV